MNGRIRIASVGLGWASTNRHLPSIRREARLSLVGVVDKHPEQVAAIAKRYRIELTAVTDHPHDVEWLHEVDAVCIGTPPATHFDLAAEFLRAGKHVLVEKPMAMHPAEAQTLLEIAESQSRVLAVVHNFQFARSVRRLMAMLETHHLGRVDSIWAAQLSNPKRRLPRWYESLPLGLFYDESPHFLYLVRRLAGTRPVLESVRVTKSPTLRSTPRSVTTNWIAGGLPIQIDMNFEAPVSEWQICVICDQGLGIVDVFRDILVVLPNDAEHGARQILRTSLRSTTSHWLGTASSGIRMLTGNLDYGNVEVMRRFADAIVGQSEADGISGRDGAEVVGMQHEVLAAAA